jgi:hypothetical protein
LFDFDVIELTEPVEGVVQIVDWHRYDPIGESGGVLLMACGCPADSATQQRSIRVSRVNRPKWRLRHPDFKELA